MTSLRVRVNDEFVLDAGTREVIVGARGGEQIVHPPTRTMFDQVVAYLRTRPAPSPHQRRSGAGIEGLAAASVALRWGSYLAVLFDRDKSVSPDAKVGISRISDDEMARINIEASAALAAWIDILHTDFAEHLDLVDRAIAYLPLVHRTAVPRNRHIMALASPEIASQLIEASDPTLLTRVRADANRHPNRLFANALVNVAWRNGPAENVHAGKSWSHPLDQRRVTPVEERKIIRFASDRLAMGMDVCHRFMAEQPRRPWCEQVLPFGLTSFLLITPSKWTLTENSREVHLPLTCPGSSDHFLLENSALGLFL